MTREDLSHFAGAAGLRGEIPALVRIGAPLTLTAMANMSLAITDVVMMGWIGALELGAGAAISDLYSILFYLAAGVAAAGAPILSSQFGGHSTARLRGTFAEVVIATLGFGLLLAPAVWHGAVVLELLGIEAKVLPDATRYAHWMALTMLPMLAVRACVSWFSAIERTHVVLIGTLITIPANIVGNGMFMFGWFGAPAMGMPGAGVSSFVIAVLLAAGLLTSVRRSAPYTSSPATDPSRRGIFDCWATGLPIGISSLAEVGVFLGATVVMVTFGAAAVAAHAVALRLSGVLYALTLGISQAVTVRVARWNGAGNDRKLRDTVYTATAFGAVICIADIVVVWYFADSIVAVVLGAEHAGSTAFALAVILVRVLAPIEGISALAGVAIGSLRGLKDTRVPMVYSLVGLWGVGAPIAIYLGFSRGLGATGIWLGLLLGVVAVAIPCITRALRVFSGRSERVDRMICPTFECAARGTNRRP